MMAKRFVSTTSTSCHVIWMFQLLLVLVAMTTSVSARLTTNTNQVQSEQQQQQQQAAKNHRHRHHRRYLTTKLIPDQFIVQIADTASRRSILQQLNQWSPESNVLYRYKHALKGFAVAGIAEAVLQEFMESLVNPGDIILIEPDYTIELYTKEYGIDDDDDDIDNYYEYPLPEHQQQSKDPSQTQQEPVQQQQQERTGATWGLDRVDQRILPLDETFMSMYDGSGVDVYIIDTGVMSSHQEFTSNNNGNSRVTLLKDFTNDADGIDYNGHGTHVAGIAAGQTYGLAPGANIISVKVLDNNGSGSNSGVIAGIDWVAKKHKNNGNGALSVANLSLGSFFSLSTNQAVEAMANAGVVVAVAAGNSNSFACLTSPASALGVITVGASTIDDTRSSFSNFGICIDIFAPGTDITSAWIASDTDAITISGTSMASPHVAGAAALLLQADPSTTGTEAVNNLIGMASKDKLNLDIAVLSPNRLLYTGKIGSNR